MAIQLINKLSKPFKPENYANSYTEEVKRMIKKKAKGEKIVVKEEAKKSTKVHNILSLLKESLAKREKSKKRKSA